MFRLQGIDYTSLGDMLEHDRVGAGPVDKRDKSRLLILGEFLSLASNEDFLQLCILISSLPAPAQINLWKCELNLLSPERWEMLFDAFMQHNTISSIDLCNNNLAKLGIDFWKHFPALTRSRTQPLTLSLWKNGLEKLDPACWESLCNAIENSRCPLTLVLRDNQLDEFSPTQWVRLCHAIQNCTSPLSLDLRERNTYCRDSHSSRPARPILVEHPFTSQQFIQLEEAIRRSPIVNIRVHNAEQHQKLQLIVRERQRTFLKSLLRFNFEGNAASERVGILPLEVLSIINQAVGLPDESSTSKMPAPMLSCDLNEYGCEHFVPLAEANDLVGLEAACQREWAIHGDILWHHCSEEPSAALKCAAHTAIQLGHIEIINYLFEKRLMFETGDEL
ncbi:MAG: hypothetical protein HY939_06155, partial [Gammaproteobacteria bacterium]|nr:hypothetical protein [Gammaproteobacteria bacterium]